MTGVFLLLFLLSVGLDWPSLPGHIRLAEVLAIPALFGVVSAGGRDLRFHMLDAAVIAYVVAGAIGLIASSDRSASVLELARHAYLAVIYALVALAIVRGFRHTVIVGLSGAGALLAAVGVGFALLFLVRPVTIPAAGELMKLPYAGELLRVRGFTASPTMLACLLTMALPFAVVAWIEAPAARRRRTAVIAIAVMALALVMTFSHAWTGAALAVTLVSWPLLAQRRVLRAASIAAVVLLAALFNASLAASVRAVSIGDEAVSDRTTYPYDMGGGTAQLGPVTVDYAVMSYLRTKQLAIEAFVEHPLTGIGLDRFHDVTQAAYRDGRLTYGYREIDPHSSLLGRLAETGLIGGLTLVLLWLGIIVTARRLIRADASDPWLARAALAGFAGLLLAGINVDIMNFRFLWAGVGVLRGLADGNA